MAYRILNWEKYQARVDRPKTPWVKLHKELLNSRDFHSIPVTRRWEWPCLLLMSDEHDGIIRKSDDEIGFALYHDMSKSFDSKPFISRLIVDYDLSLDIDKEQDSVAVGNQVEPTDTKRNHNDTNHFEKFWEIYPRKEEKKRSAEIWKKLKPDAELVAQIIASVERQSESEQWKKDGGCYIPQPSRYLNQRRWEDDFDIRPKVRGNGKDGHGRLLG